MQALGQPVRLTAPSPLGRGLSGSKKASDANTRVVKVRHALALAANDPPNDPPRARAIRIPRQKLTRRPI